MKSNMNFEWLVAFSVNGKKWETLAGFALEADAMEFIKNRQYPEAAGHYNLLHVTT